MHPATDPKKEDFVYPFVFHPLELGETALLELFGYQLEGTVDPSRLEPEDIRFCASKGLNPGGDGGSQPASRDFGSTCADEHNGDQDRSCEALAN
jgi:hypothetical protein